MCQALLVGMYWKYSMVTFNYQILDQLVTNYKMLLRPNKGPFSEKGTTSLHIGQFQYPSKCIYNTFFTFEN